MNTEASMDALSENVPNRVYESSQDTSSDGSPRDRDTTILISSSIFLMAARLERIVLPTLSHRGVLDGSPFRGYNKRTLRGDDNALEGIEKRHS